MDSLDIEYLQVRIAPDGPGPTAIEAFSAELYDGDARTSRDRPDLEPAIREPETLDSELLEPETLDSSAEFYLGALQGILFVAGRPVSAAEVARSLRVDEEYAERLLARLSQQFLPGGLQVVKVAGGYEMLTRPEYDSLVTRFLEPPPHKLSNAALETVALIAYRQPLTQPEIEAIRGVKSDSPLRTLVERGLVEEAGRKDVVGRPILYRTTPELLMYLGIDNLSELPGLEPGAGETAEEA